MEVVRCIPPSGPLSTHWLSQTLHLICMHNLPTLPTPTPSPSPHIYAHFHPHPLPILTFAPTPSLSPSLSPSHAHSCSLSPSHPHSHAPSLSLSSSPSITLTLTLPPHSHPHSHMLPSHYLSAVPPITVHHDILVASPGTGGRHFPDLFPHFCISFFFLLLLPLLGKRRGNVCFWCECLLLRLISPVREN